jgi:hypothetical protein
MKKLFIFITCLLLVSPVSISAQRKAVKKQGKNVVADDPKFLSMLNSTAQLTVIDSIVVDSASYLDAILANPEEGRVTTYDRFFEGEGKEIVYLNEIGNKCIYSGYDEDLETKVLYQRTLLGDGWTYGEELQGLNDDGRLYDFDYPYLMPDGVTLYFSAKSVDGLGGYDIYRTRFDADKKLLEHATSLPLVEGERLKTGLICTGDQFITDRGRLDVIKGNFPDGMACDMESAAIAQTCHLLDIPFLSLRVISDTPGRTDDHQQQWADFLASMCDRSFHFVKRFLETL